MSPMLYRLSYLALNRPQVARNFTTTALNCQIFEKIVTYTLYYIFLYM